MNVGVLVFPQVEDLDFVGPREMLGLWHQIAAGPAPLIVAERTGAVACANGLSINPHVSFEDCPSLDRLRSKSDVTVVEQRWVRDGIVWTSAGVSAGIDLTLAFIAAEAGEQVAAKVRRVTEYHPSGSLAGS